MKTVLLFLSSVLLLIILIEGMARLHGSYADYVVELNNWNRAMKRQFSWPTTNKSQIERNRFKIVAIGDSFTFGQGISDVTKIWPARLEKCLRLNLKIRDLGIGIEVINLGHNGADFQKEISLLTEYSKKNLDIDFVLHQVFLNDYLVHYEDGIAPYKYRGNPGSTPIVGSDLFFHSLFYWKKFNFIHVAKRHDFIGWLKKWEAKELKHWDKHNEDLSTLIKTVDKIGAGLISFLVPSNLWEGNDYPLREFHRNIVDSARRLASYEILDISGRLFEEFSSGYDHWINSFDSHPSETMHEAYGNIMCEVLVPAILSRSIN